MSSTRLSPTGSEEVETILVVEDEEEVRKVVCLTLQLQGYRVLGAATANQAMAILRSSADSVHLLIADVVLPGTSGPDLAVQALQENPTLQVLFVSGYAEDSLLEHGISSNHPAFLPKPFSAATLGRKVRSMLSPRR